MIERVRLVVWALAHRTRTGWRAVGLGPGHQDRLAARPGAHANERRWQELLNEPDRVAAVDDVADEALAAFESGKTRPLSEVLSDER